MRSSRLKDSIASSRPRSSAGSRGSAAAAVAFFPLPPQEWAGAEALPAEAMRILTRPPIAPGHPEIGGMAEQFDLAVLVGAQPSRHALGGDVLAVDAMNDPVEFEIGERPVDRP